MAAYGYFQAITFRCTILIVLIACYLSFYYTRVGLTSDFWWFGASQLTSSWNGLLTTDMNIDFFKAWEIYSRRWALEVVFKDCKTNLGFGKCQSTCFASQIAAATLCCLQLLVSGKTFDEFLAISLPDSRCRKRIWVLKLHENGLYAHYIAFKMDFIYSFVLSYCKMGDFFTGQPLLLGWKGLVHHQNQ